MYEVGAFSTAQETSPRVSVIGVTPPTSRTISISALAREINDVSGRREFGTLYSQEHQWVVGERLLITDWLAIVFVVANRSGIPMIVGYLAPVIIAGDIYLGIEYAKLVG